jgi:serine acetyltransferase
MKDKNKAWPHFKECIRREVLGEKHSFSALKVLHRYVKKPHVRFYFWFRVAQYFYFSGGDFQKSIGKFIQIRNNRRFATDIDIETQIGPGLTIAHYPGVVITNFCQIGENLIIRQNCTIGWNWKMLPLAERIIYIGDNVEIGANSCVLGSGIHIGDNVKIGAMSFVNKDVPSNVTVYTEKTNKIVQRPNA